MVNLALRAEKQEHANIMWAIHRQPGSCTSESKKIQTCSEGKPFNFFPDNKNHKYKAKV